MTRAVHLRPPEALPTSDATPRVFLAGSIEQGVAVDWQARVVEALRDRAVTLLNPRRQVWDASLAQTAQSAPFVEQVNWELDGLEQASLIAMYLDPGTKAPISLLELGLFARSGKLVVCCPQGFWRRGNVEIVCARYGARQVETLEALIQAIHEHVEGWTR